MSALITEVIMQALFLLHYQTPISDAWNELKPYFPFICSSDFYIEAMGFVFLSSGLQKQRDVHDLWSEALLNPCYLNLQLGLNFQLMVDFVVRNLNHFVIQTLSRSTYSVNGHLY